MMNKVVLLLLLLLLFYNNIVSSNRNLEKLETHLLEELDFHFHIIGVIVLYRDKNYKCMQINQ